MAGAESSQVKAAIIAAVATIAAALIGLAAVFIPRLDDGSGDGGVTTTNPGQGAASVYLNSSSGPAGTTISVSGEGYASGEEVVIRFHTNEVGSTTVNDQGKFQGVSVTVPSSYANFATQLFYVVATGRTSLRSDQAPFTVTG